MKSQKITIEIFSKKCTLNLMKYEKSDGRIWRKIFNSWKELKMGLRKFKSREPNIPEGISEVAFCLWSQSQRFISGRGLSSSSFDTYNLKTKKAEQIKACSVENDLTSFGPKSKWDHLYFLDFYNEGKVDGVFDVYLIPNDLIDQISVNKLEKFTDQQGQKRRPRFSIKKEIIQKNQLLPLARSVKVW